MKKRLGCSKLSIIQMRNTIFKRILLAMLSLTLVIMGIGITYVDAAQEFPLDNIGNENPLEIMIDPSNNPQSENNEDIKLSAEGTESSAYPDLGDDQVFPFVAGLDSYE